MSGIDARLMAAAAARAERARGDAAGALAARAEEQLSGSDIAVALAEDGDLRLRGRGLLARAFGSRKRAADPRFAGLLATLARGDRT